MRSSQSFWLYYFRTRPAVQSGYLGFTKKRERERELELERDREYETEG